MLAKINWMVDEIFVSGVTGQVCFLFVPYYNTNYLQVNVDAIFSTSSGMSANDQQNGLAVFVLVED